MKITEKNVTKEDFNDAIRTINCYYRKLTGKKDCLKFYVDMIQPIKIHLEEIEKSKK